MGFYAEQIVPRLTHFALNSEPIRKLRAETLGEAKGTVLEVGFGSGLNLPFYPSSVSRVLAVEPSALACKMAEKAISAARFPVEFVGLDGQKLGVDSGSIDSVVATWTLCTIPNPVVALSEFARVLKPGGSFFFIEHGLSPDKNVARWQQRFNGLQMRIAGGCNLNRRIESLITSSPLKITSIEKFYFEGPRTHSYFYRGSAIKPNDAV